MSRFLLFSPAIILGLATLEWTASLSAACGFFSANNDRVVQPAQQVFLTWDPAEQVETITVQPAFAGRTLDFGMVIPTPSRPKVDSMPRDFFKHLAVFSILKRREYPATRLLPPKNVLADQASPAPAAAVLEGGPGRTFGAPAITVLQTGVVGSLHYKIIEAGRADDLFRWLKENNYNYRGDEATLNHYVQKKWFFTVMKVDTTKAKRNPDGSIVGEVAPIRLQFTSATPVYPLKMAQISVKDKMDTLIYVQAPYKVDLPGDHSYQYTWVPMLEAARLEAARRHTPGGLPGGGTEWLESFKGQIDGLAERAKNLEYRYVEGRRPSANSKGRTPTTLEWARKLTETDLQVLAGAAPYSEKLPNVDEGFTQADLKFERRGDAVRKVIETRLEKARKDRPLGYLVREAPADEVRDLQNLAGHLQEGWFITKLRKAFARDEMNDDLVIVPARYNDAIDTSEYQELLSLAPPAARR
jgi:Uncharacterized protein conserved in bacteria (DUF2330)